MPDPATPPPSLPYQAYKPKRRHSRNLSSPNAPAATVPAAAAQAPPTSSPLSQLRLPEEISRTSARQPPPSPRIVLAPPSPIAPLTNGLPSPPASNHSHESPDSPVDAFQHNDSPEMVPNTIPVERAAPRQSVRTLAHVSQAAGFSATTSTSPSGSSITSPGPEQPAQALPPRTSKFRHVPLRKPHPSSPLAAVGKELHSRTSSASSLLLPQQNLSVLPATLHIIPSEPQLPAPAPRTMSPAVSPSPPQGALPPLPTTKVEPSPKPVVPIPVSSSISSPAASKKSSVSSDLSEFPSPAPSQRTGTSRSLAPNRLSVPYRPGFQPKGVYRHLTDDFLAIRKLKRDGAGERGGMKRVERNKLERRLEKLIDLHFPADLSRSQSSVNTSNSPRQRPGLNNAVHESKRASSIFDLDTLRSINIRDPGDLWKTVLAGNFGDSGKMDIRAMEQRITPWEEDPVVFQCPLCLASFHPLTNRKHHCRLCGRIICSLPPKHPQRPATCSLLFVVDMQSRRIEEVGEGVDYGVKRRRSINAAKSEDLDSDEKFLKGVRICRECRPILLRQQQQQERTFVPTFVRLHETLIALEQDIEEALPQFQELVLALNHNDQPTKEASAARKRLLEAFAQYDALAKRIKQLPCPNGSGGSQQRIQTAILMRANLFLQKNMFPLQSLPSPSGNKTEGLAPESSALGGLVEEQAVDPNSELAKMLQPLLEQEALLESFVEEAKMQRKFEDVKTLKVNLQEIRKEIERLLDGADINTKNSKRKDR